MKRSAVRSVLAVLVAMLLLCSMALAVGGGVAGAGAAAAGSITGQTAAPSKPQPAETNQPSAAVVESPTEAGSEDASDDGETSNGGLFARIAEFFRTLLEPRKDSGEMVEKTFGEIRDAINFGFNTVENTLRDSGNFPFIDGSAVVGAIANVMLPIGLLVFLICWSLQVMRSGLELELYEVKHFIKMGMEFIAGLLLVTIAPQICRLITAISDNMASSLLDTVSIHYADIAETLPSTDIGDFASKIPIIGVLVQ